MSLEETSGGFEGEMDRLLGDVGLELVGSKEYVSPSGRPNLHKF